MMYDQDVFLKDTRIAVEQREAYAYPDDRYAFSPSMHYSDWYFVHENEGWKCVQGQSILEEEFAYALHALIEQGQFAFDAKLR